MRNKFSIGTNVTIHDELPVYRVFSFRETYKKHGVPFFEYQVETLLPSPAYTQDVVDLWFFEDALSLVPYGPSYGIGDKLGDLLVSRVFLSVNGGWNYYLWNSTSDSAVYLSQQQITDLSESLQE